MKVKSVSLKFSQVNLVLKYVQKLRNIGLDGYNSIINQHHKAFVSVGSPEQPRSTIGQINAMCNYKLVHYVLLIKGE